MAIRKQTLSASLFFLFVFVVLSSSYACVESRPAGVYERGRPHSAHRAGVGRAAGRNFKAGFLVAKTDSSKLRKNVRKHLGLVHVIPETDSMSRVPALLFPVPKDIVLDLSPVLNL